MINVDNKIKIIASNENVEVSSSDDGLKLYVKANLGFLDDYNLNNVALLNSPKAQQSVQTIVNMPIKGRLKEDIFGNSKFGGHEAYKDSNGTIRFGTETIGTHYKAYIEDAEVSLLHGNREKSVKPCIFAEAIIWRDEYPEYANAVEKIYNEGRLGTSWELIGNEVGDDGGLSEELGIESARAYSAWTFTANTIIGVNPAYGENSKIVNIAESEDFNTILSEALAIDVQKKSEDSKDDTFTSKKEDKDINANTNISNEGSKDMEEKLKDLQEQLDVANAKLKEFEDADKDSKISELEEKVETLTKEKSEIEDKLIKASEKVENLTNEVAELTPFKETVEKIEAEKAEAEKAEKIEQLKTMVTKGGYVTEAELESSEEIKSMIENCEEEKLKVLRAERILSKLDSEEASKPKDKETSETRVFDEAKGTDYRTEIKNFLGLV